MEASGYAVNFLEQLGLDPETFTWHDLALCDGIPDADVYFDKYENDKTVARQIDEMCLHCPVLKQCAETGMKNRERGVWGGIYWNGSGKPDANFNAHKSEETWTQIRERLSE